MEISVFSLPFSINSFVDIEFFFNDKSLCVFLLLFLLVLVSLLIEFIISLLLFSSFSFFSLFEIFSFSILSEYLLSFFKSSTIENFFDLCLILDDDGDDVFHLYLYLHFYL